MLFIPEVNIYDDQRCTDITTERVQFARAGEDKVERIERLTTALMATGQEWRDSNNGARRLHDALTSANGVVDRLEGTIQRAREAVAEATLTHDGCEEGKKAFLRSTGLWTDEEVEDMFDTEVDATVTVRIEAFSVEVGMTLMRSIVRNEDTDHIEVDQYAVDEAVRSHLRHVGVDDWYVEAVEEA